MTIALQASATPRREKSLQRVQAIAFPVSIAYTSKQIRLAKNTDIESAFQIIVFNCIDQILENQANLAAAYDMESLHQLRVGLRRLRTAFSSFESSLPIPDVIQAELKYFARQLNPARDWDVLLTSILPDALDGMEKRSQPGEAFMHLVRQMAQVQQDIACAALKSERFTLSIGALCLWMHGLGWRDALKRKGIDNIKKSAKKIARRQMECTQDLLSNACYFNRFKSDKILHKARITIKNLRYATEFFNSFASAKKGKSSLQELSTLQDYLGRNNDIAVAIRLLSELEKQDSSLQKNVAAVGDHFRFLAKLNKKEMRRYWSVTTGRRQG